MEGKTQRYAPTRPRGGRSGLEGEAGRGRDLAVGKSGHRWLLKR